MSRIAFMKILWFSVFALASCSGNTLSDISQQGLPLVNSHGSAEQTENIIEFAENQDEYSIYSLVISDLASRSNSDLLVIDELTSGLKITPSSPEKGFVEETLNKLKVHRECVDNFMIQNGSVWRLSKNLSLEKEYRFARDELEQIGKDMRSGSDGWKNYYNRYPKSQGLLSLSRVGFCGKGRIGIVYVANYFAGDGGWGKLVIVEKSQGEKWRILRERPLWVS